MAIRETYRCTLVVKSSGQVDPLGGSWLSYLNKEITGVETVRVFIDKNKMAFGIRIHQVREPVVEPELRIRQKEIVRSPDGSIHRIRTITRSGNALNGYLG